MELRRGVETVLPTPVPPLPTPPTPHSPSTAGRVQTRDHAVSLAVKSVLDPARRGPGGSQPVAEADATSEGGVSLSTLLTEAGGKGRDKVRLG